jgi:hypothetical protein
MPGFRGGGIDDHKMNKSQPALSLLLLFFTIDLYGNEKPDYSFWIQVIDQAGKPITEAIVYSCIFDCVLTRNAHNRKSTLTNEYGYAQLKLKGRDDLRLQGIEKDGYDIRLTTLPFNQVWLQGVDKQPKRSNYFKAHQGIHIRYGIGINPYSQPIKNPLFIVRGWKLSSPACLE